MTMRISRTRCLTTVLLAFVLVALLAGCGAEEPDTIAPEPPAVENEGEATTPMPDADAAQALVETKCSGCHELGRVWAADHDRAGWESTVARMEANGLQVTAEEREIIIDYLAQD